MGASVKYGRVTVERGDIGEDEPVFVFRAQDQVLPGLLKIYKILCELAGSPANHLVGIHYALRIVEEWQAVHPTRVPISASLVPPDR